MDTTSTMNSMDMNSMGMNSMDMNSMAAMVTHHALRAIGTNLDVLD